MASSKNILVKKLPQSATAMEKKRKTKGDIIANLESKLSVAIAESNKPFILSITKLINYFKSKNDT